MRELHAEAPQVTASDGLAQGPYVAARAGFKPATLPTKGVESTNEPPRHTTLKIFEVFSLIWFKYNQFISFWNRTLPDDSSRLAMRWTPLMDEKRLAKLWRQKDIVAKLDEDLLDQSSCAMSNIQSLLDPRSAVNIPQETAAMLHRCYVTQLLCNTVTTLHRCYVALLAMLHRCYSTPLFLLHRCYVTKLLCYAVAILNFCANSTLRYRKFIS